MNILTALLCVFLFGLTAPFTRLASFETSPETIILMRILGAGVVCLLFFSFDRWVPPKNIWKGIIATALGTVVGFNSLMAYAMREVPAGHAAVALAALPIVTVIYSVIRDRMNPGFKFWFFAIWGTLLSFGFFFSMNVQSLLHGDVLLLLSVLSAAFGYVEGGRMSRIYGGSRIMSWAILVTLPVAALLALVYFSRNPNELQGLSSVTWFSLSYVALISQSLGMFLWFKVLGKGPLEKIALVQLLQPFFTLFAAIILLEEKVLFHTWIVAGLVAVCVFASNKEKASVLIVK